MGKYPLQDVCLAVICGTPFLASMFVGLRLYARRKFSTHLGWDDHTIILATVLSIALIYPSVRFTQMWNFGVHIWDVDQRKIEPKYDEFHKVLLAFNLLNTLILPLVKASIIILLLRVSSVITSIKRVLYTVFVFNVSACIIPFVILIFQCPPLTGNTWAPRVFGDLHCMGRPRIGQVQLFQTCANLLTDILIFPIPFILMRKLERTSIRTRLIIAFLFATSLGVTAIGAAKIYETYNDRLYSTFENDWTYNISFCINHAENNCAIVIACVPALRGLIVRWISKEPDVEAGRRRPHHGHPHQRRHANRRPARFWPSDKPHFVTAVCHRERPREDSDFSDMTSLGGSGGTSGCGSSRTGVPSDPRRAAQVKLNSGLDSLVTWDEKMYGYSNADSAYLGESTLVTSEPTVKTLDDLQFITVKSGIL